MEALFKLLIYVVIIVIWVISNIKKQGKWEEKIPEFPKEPSPPFPDSRQKRPQREGDFDQISQREKARLRQMTYDEVLAMRRKKFQTIKEKNIKKSKPKLKMEFVPSFEGPPPAEEKPAQPLIIPETIEEKPAYRLQSSIKDGIIWSIILGPPRSKLPFERRNPPIKR